MKIEPSKIVFHDLRSYLDQINSLYSCILFDYKDNKPIKNADLSDLRKALRSFEDNLQILATNAPKESGPLIKIEEDHISHEIPKNYQEVTVLLENDALIRRVWHNIATRNNILFKSFETIHSLENDLAELSKNTVFYIDSILGDGERGELYAKKLFERGFKNLYLSTGYKASKFKDCHWLKGVIGKEPPF